MRVQGSVRTAGEAPLISIGDKVNIPRTIEITGEDVEGHDLSIRAEYNPDSGRYECRELTVSARSGNEVTGESLRSIPVMTVLKLGVNSALQATTLLSMGPLPDDITEGGPTTRALEWVAYLYRVALIFGEAPVAAVAEAMKLPRSTANRWVTRARDRGLLTVQDRRGQRDRKPDGKSMDRGPRQTR